MPFNSGTFSGKITKQTTMSLTDQSAHDMNIAEVAGTQKSADALWDNSKITYWGVTDLSTARVRSAATSITSTLMGDATSERLRVRPRLRAAG